MKVNGDARAFQATLTAVHIKNLMKNILLASTSTLFGGKYLDYIKNEISELFQDTTQVIFIPYARPGGISYDEYTSKARGIFEKIGKELVGIHTFKDPVKGLQEAQGLFTGGGNTFVLVDTLYRLKMMEVLRQRILEGLPYLGSSAGSNICGISMNTTNDMPIVYPPSFKTLGVVPFNINPHYLDPDVNSKHMGETRETRIKEFHSQSTVPVVGLREGSWIRVKGNQNILMGNLSARIFQQGQDPIELPSGKEIIFR